MCFNGDREQLVGNVIHDFWTLSSLFVLMLLRRANEKNEGKKWFLHIVEWECYFWPTFYCFFFIFFSSCALVHHFDMLLLCVHNFFTFSYMLELFSRYINIFFGRSLNGTTATDIHFTYCNSINIFMIISITYLIHLLSEKEKWTNFSWRSLEATRQSLHYSQ